MAKNNGGPAFPRPSTVVGGYTPAQEGMTLLHYYAGQALVGLLARSTGPAALIDPVHIATTAWKLANAMLEAMLEARGE